jgi:hypothetical protein
LSSVFIAIFPVSWDNNVALKHLCMCQISSLQGLSHLKASSYGCKLFGCLSK